MKKLILIFLAVITTFIASAQISRPGGSADGKIGEFTKLVTSLTGGQRVDYNRVQSLYNEINCMLIETQSEALSIGLENTREETCGSSVFPTNQTISDSSFKKYAEQVQKYLEWKKKTGK